MRGRFVVARLLASLTESWAKVRLELLPFEPLRRRIGPAIVISAVTQVGSQSEATRECCLSAKATAEVTVIRRIAAGNGFTGFEMIDGSRSFGSSQPSVPVAFAVLSDIQDGLQR